MTSGSEASGRAAAESAITRTFLKRTPQGGRRFRLAGLIVTVLFSLFYIYRPDLFRILDLRISDALMRGNRDLRPSADVAIIDIDEPSLARYGQWPWPRYRVAGLLRAVRDAGASAIGIDSVFAEADRTSLGVVRRELEREYGRAIPLGDLPPDLADNDRVLAGTLAEGPFVLGYQFLFGTGLPAAEACRLHPVSAAFIGSGAAEASRLPFFRATGAVCSRPEFGEAVTASGFFNILADTDGLMRRVPLIIRYDGPGGPAYYPSLALAALMKARGAGHVSVKVESGRASEILFDEFRIPIDASGNMALRFLSRSGRAFPVISASDVLSGRTPGTDIRGKIVFVGTTSMGFGERKATPVDPFLPGVEIHATAAQNILRRQHILNPSWVPGVELLLVVTTGILSALLLARTGAVWGLIGLPAAAAGLWFASGWLFRSRGIFISPLVPFLTLAANFGSLTLLKFRREESLVRKRTEEVLQANKATEESLARLWQATRGTIKALASAAEHRDPYTGGHQRRVADLARAIALEMGLPADRVDGLHLAGIVHDLGKISLPASILSMPRRLTELEYSLVKTHSRAGFDILKDIEFPWPIARMVLEHHERMDGSGYPDGLTGDRQLLESRILAVADVIEAVATHRPYRPAQGIDRALEIIEAGKGALYDPDAVDACLRLFREKRYSLAE